MRRACQRVRGSAVLKDVLRLVLSIGNVLNEDSRLGGALSVRLESLLRLPDVKVTQAADVGSAAGSGSNLAALDGDAGESLAALDGDDGERFAALDGDDCEPPS